MDSNSIGVFLLYVEDMLIASKQDVQEIEYLKQNFKAKLEMKDLEIAQRILVMGILSVKPCDFNRDCTEFSRSFRSHSSKEKS